MTIAKRFWAKVVRGPSCWLWTGSTNRPGGYGRFRCGGGQRIVAHRWAWEQVNGPVPPGMVLCHACDTPACVRLDHLFLGTMADNNRDRARKGRSKPLRGQANPQAKLTDRAVLAIRQAADPQNSLAQRFGVSQATISAIKRGKVWNHVTSKNP